MERASYTWDISAPSAKCIARWEDDGGSVIDVSERRVAVPSQRTRVAIVGRTAPRSFTPHGTAPTHRHMQAVW
jgi:hypothetical protein